MNCNVLVSFNLLPKYMETIQNISSRVKVRCEWEDSLLIDAIRDAEVVLAGKMNREMMKAATQLKWIHTWGAGVDRLLVIPEIAMSSVILTNSRGVHPIQLSEHVMALMLAFTRNLKEYILYQSKGVWFRREWPSLHELKGKTVGIIGLGIIGREIAKKAKFFGMRVLASKRRMIKKPHFVDELYLSDALIHILKQSDFIVISCPLTPITKGMIGVNELKTMKKTAYIINIARGKIIQQQALIEALQKKWIAGAGLDVFEVEPLPSSSELWTMKNVIITPHVAGATINYAARVIKIFCNNLERYLENKSLINVVDKKAGY